MRTSVHTAGAIPDLAKWIGAFIILGGGVAGFYYWSDESLLLRVIGLLVLSAVARLRERGTPVKMIVAGKGDARAALEETARRLGIADGVHFAGFVPDARKRELLSRSWVHALTSPKEGWGITSIEASACGTPTVASDSPGLRETVRHGETGLLVPHGEVDALAAALGRVLEPAARDRMGRAARTMAERYTWDGVADAFEDLLHSVVARRGRRAGPGSPGFPGGRAVLN